MQYRSDIDGLRGIAVGSVLLFHAFPTLVPGGFLGVDVFFVISGYLISQLLLAEMRAGRFSILRFYERRVRRILPAFLAMSAVSFVAASALLLPFDFRDAGGGMAAATLFVSNQYFLVDTDYFDGSGDLHPFLHTWSLSVEEQFYLLFPLLLLGLLRWRPRWLGPSLIGLTAASLWLSLHSAHGNPNFSFYSAPTRAWELLTGALLAVGIVPKLASAALREAVAAVGLASVLLACGLSTSGGPMPGLINLLPVGGAALLIHAGGAGNPWATRVLRLKPLLWLGLVSYSLYLWHWPIFALARYANVAPLSVAQSLLAIALALLLAWASWRLVENPVRSKQVLATRRSLFAVTAALSFVLVALGAVAYFAKGLPQRLPQAVAQLGLVNPATTGFINADRRICMEKTAEDVAKAQLCKLGLASQAATPRFLLWGDSHSEALRGALDKAARQSGVGGLHAGRGSCPPIPGLRRFDTLDAADECLRFNSAVLDWLHQQPELRTVFLHSRWALNYFGSRYEAEAGVPALLSAGGSGNNAQILERSLASLLSQLQGMGKSVVLVAGIPEVAVKVPYAMAMNRYLGRQLDIRPTRREFELRNAPVKALFERLQQQFSNLSVIYPDQTLCTAEWCAVTDASGQPLYADSNHLTPLGSRSLAPLFLPLLRE